MKQIFQILMVSASALFFPMQNTVYAQASEIRSRLIAATKELYDGSHFRPEGDSLRIHWHDTCGTGFDYSFYGYEPDYLETEFVGYKMGSPRLYREMWYPAFDTMSTYAPAPAGAGYLPTPISSKVQSITSPNRIDSQMIAEGGQEVERREFFYDASGNRVSVKIYTATSTGPELNSIDSLSYDNNGNLLSEKWTSMSVATPYVSRNEYIYGSNNRVEQYDHFSDNGGVPLLAARAVYSYNTSGQRINVLQMEADPVTGVLANSVWEGYSYNGSNQMDSRSRVIWSGTVGDTMQRIFYEYGTVADRPEVAYVLQGASLDTNVKIRWLFNGDDLCDSVIVYLYSATGQWVPFRKTTLRYNDFGQIIFADTKSGWNNATSSWSNRYQDLRSSYYYETFDTITGIKNSEPLLTFLMYPNPVHGVLHIRSGSEPIRSLSVYDLAGRILIRQLYSGNPNSEIVLQLGALPAGVYTLKVDGKQSYGSKKFTVH